MNKYIAISTFGIFTAFLSGCGKQGNESQVKITPIDLVKRYKSATSVEDRYQYVIQTTSVSNKMFTYYSKADLSSPDEFRSINTIGATNEAVVRVSTLSNDRDIPFVYYVVDTPEGYKIDWIQSIFHSDLDSPESLIWKYIFTSEIGNIQKYLYPTENLDDLIQGNFLYAYEYNKPSKKEKFDIKTQGVLSDGTTELWDFKGENNKVFMQFFLRKYSGTHRILWEPTAMYNPMTFVKLKALKPKESHQFRVLAKLDDYFNFEYINCADTHFSIELEDPHSNERVHGYLDKKSKQSESLIEYLEDGKKHFMMVEIQYNQGSQNSSIVKINDIIDFGIVGAIKKPTTDSTKKSL